MQRRSAVKYILAMILCVAAAAFLLRQKITAVVELAIVARTTADVSLHDGDLIFQTSRSTQSLAIQHATGSPWSHMGMILLRDGKPYVLEAAATVRYTALANWIMRGNGHHFTVKRLRDADHLLTSTAIGQLEHEAQTFIGRPYDSTFEWSDDRIYCSELVWKIYHQALNIDIGKLQRIKDFNLSDPVVATVLKQRYGDAVPLDEPVIAPVAMYQSALLTTIEER